MSNVLTLAGTPLTTSRTQPIPRLSTCEITALSRDLVPLNNCLLALEAELRRLHALLGGQTDEWIHRLEEICERVVEGEDS